MPTSRNIGKDCRDYGLLGFFVLLAYLPLSSFRFALKNDALTANFPHKYFFSAALHAGHLPLWNPYVDFGLPLYADPGFAFWNPITWLFGLIGYDIHLLTVEVLTFIWLGGIFMHRLARTLGHSRLTALLLGLIYSCCGFFVGNLTHINFITAAAFLPLVLSGFLKLQSELSPKHLLSTSLALYLTTAGGHPAIPVATCYFLLMILAGWMLTDKQTPLRNNLTRTLRTNAILVAATGVLVAPILLSWAEIAPYIDRSTPVFQPGQEKVGFSIPSWLSFLLPFATTANTSFFGTVRSMRDAYFSLPGLVLFVFALFHRKNRLQTIFLVSGAGMLLLSLGGPIKSTLYSHLPLLGYISNNGEYRVFTILSFLVVVSWPLDRLLTGQMPPESLNRILNGLMILAAMAAILAAFLPWTSAPAPAANFVDKTKYWLDTLPFGPRLLFSAILLLVLLSGWRLGHRLQARTILPLILATDLLLSSWLILPVTGVQRRSPAEVESLLARIPAGIPLPAMTSIGGIRSPTPDFDRVLGDWPYFAKQPGTPQQGHYPTRFRSTIKYFGSSWPDSIARWPFLFLVHTPALPTLTGFSPTRIAATASASSPDTLVLLQNDYPGWETFLDDKPCRHTTAFLSFMAIPIPPDGHAHRVSYRFSRPQIGWYLLIALCSPALLFVWMWKEQRLTRAARDRKIHKDGPARYNRSPDPA